MFFPPAVAALRWCASCQCPAEVIRVNVTGFCRFEPFESRNCRGTKWWNVSVCGSARTLKKTDTRLWPQFSKNPPLLAPSAVSTSPHFVIKYEQKQHKWEYQKGRVCIFLEFTIKQRHSVWHVVVTINNALCFILLCLIILYVMGVDEGTICFYISL